MPRPLIHQPPDEIRKTFLIHALLFLSAWVLSVYLQFQPQPLVWAGLALLSSRSYASLRRSPCTRREGIVFGVFALVISITLVLGFHVHVDTMETAYFGTMSENYITPYHWYDGAALALMTPCLHVLFCALYQLGCGKRAVCYAGEAPAGGGRRCALIFAVLFFCYLPYLLFFWPGAIHVDTLASVSQAIGDAPLTNNHPVVYTLFIKLCLAVGEKIFSSRTIGYALYVVFQMAYICLCLAWMIDWIWRHSRCRNAVGIAMVLLFGVTPYFAAFSVIGWKDPIFSVSIAAMSVFLLDDVLYAQQRKSIRKRLAFAALLLMIVFWRKNGIGILLFAAVWQLVSLLVRLKRKNPLRLEMPIVLCSVMLVYFVVSGPVYTAAGIETDKREANSLFLQQMARVGALNGDMTEEDRAFLNQMLPLKKYAETYRPCCVDLLKWDGQFNPDALSSDMYRHWASMLVRNPVVYFQAWQLNTFGFWTLNVPMINASPREVTGDEIRLMEDAEQIRQKYGLNLREISETMYAFYDAALLEWFIPVAWVFWGAVFVLLCMLLKGQAAFVYALMPTFGLMIPLILGSPLYYWARYAAAIQYLLPVYLMLFFMKPQSRRRAADS